MPASRKGPSMRRGRVAARRGRSVAGARVALAGPGGEDEQEARVLGGADLVALAGVEDGQEAGAAGHRLAALLDLDRALDHHEMGLLVDAVILEALARGEEERDRAGRAPVGMQYLGVSGLQVQRAEGPVTHRAALNHAPARDSLISKAGGM